MASIGTRVVTATANVARKLGAALDGVGSSLEVAKYTEKLVPSTRFVAVDGVAPVVANTTNFVAPNASVIGDVTIGNNSSVWYGATVRGDVNKVTIGDNSSVGERAVIHVAKIQGDFATKIGNDVTIGAGAIIHAATLEGQTIVGPSAQILDGSVVESETIIAPGAVVTPGTTVKTGTFWEGNPAKESRKLTEAEIKSITECSADILDEAIAHEEECAKDAYQVAEDLHQYEDNMFRDESYWQPGQDYEDDDVEGQGVPGRIFDSTLTHPERAGELKK
eukprot:CAMPEP_0178957848 /NCGR_PEP_ID=MMETSP0789-20121207/11187_1 /TAXON_ID=3005 /ORGANISM="Rhizosolenia setigera, Strain CCMP 1694" /LENGTH=277 /DNA_ID=CAMNT_0020640233 /DNA_START=94 /DNA_END=927 /DNA_ORIENTATION=+